MCIRDRNVRPSTRSRRGRRGSGQSSRSESPPKTRTADVGKESSDSGTQEREDSDHGSHDSRGHSAPTAAEEPTHRTPSMEDAPSDSGARGQRRSAIPSSHHQEQPRLEGSPGTGTPPPLSSASRSMDASLEQARRRKSAAQAAIVRRRHRLELNQRSVDDAETESCLLYTSPSPRDATLSRMPSSA